MSTAATSSRRSIRSLLLSRGAAAAAAALALTAGVVTSANATTAAVTTGEKPVVIPINPCRMMDTRTAQQIGPRSTALGPTETYTTPARGTVGNCTIPADATGLVLNITVVGGTDTSYLTVFPGGTTRPTASTLNWTAGQGATANGASVDLPASGQLSFYNRIGTVNVITDITGYYVDHNHDDRYLTETETNALLATKANTADVYGTAQVYTSGETNNTFQRRLLWASVRGSDGAKTAGHSAVTTSRMGAGQYCIYVHASVTSSGPGARVLVTPQVAGGASYARMAVTSGAQAGPCPGVADQYTFQVVTFIDDSTTAYARPVNNDFVVTLTS